LWNAAASVAWCNWFYFQRLTNSWSCPFAIPSMATF
jgi:hypothetical protein